MKIQITSDRQQSRGDLAKLTTFGWERHDEENKRKSNVSCGKLGQQWFYLANKACQKQREKV